MVLNRFFFFLLKGGCKAIDSLIFGSQPLFAFGFDLFVQWGNLVLQVLDLFLEHRLGIFFDFSIFGLQFALILSGQITQSLLFLLPHLVHLLGPFVVIYLVFQSQLFDGFIEIGSFFLITDD